jgi:flotillin
MDSTKLLTIVVVAVVVAIILLVMLRIVANMYRKVGPNQALIVYGSKAPRVITNGGTFVTLFREEATYFSLELMSFDVAPRQDLYTNQGVAVNVEAVTQLKVRSDRDSILTAAEQFLSKSDEEREGLIRLVMEGHLRGIVGQLTVEQLVKEPEMVSEKMRSISSSDLTKMGLDVVSFTIKEVRDNNDYITNMGRPEIERIKKEANIAAAQAARDTQIQQAAAMRESAIAKSQADQARVEAEAASQTKQAEYQRDLSLKKASYDAEVKKEQASADKAYDIQANVMQQQVVEESTRVQEIERTAQVKVQEAEIKRRQLELEATVLKSADADRQRVETVAEAERRRLALEAQGRAEALRAQSAAEAEAARVRGQAEAEMAKVRGLAEADIIRARGLAEAEAIRAKGEAEAEAMRVKAEAYHEYNQAAVLDKLLTGLPEMVRALAEPLSKVDRVTIVSTGSDGHNGGVGASRLTGDVVNMLAQVPAIFEMLSGGVKLEDLVSRIPGLQPSANGSTPAPEPAPASEGSAPATDAAASSPAATIVDAAPAVQDEAAPADAPQSAPAPARAPRSRDQQR